MPATKDLLGLGMPPYQAAKLGYDPYTVTCVGTTQSGAPIALSKNMITNAATGASAVVLQAASAGDLFIFSNPGTIASPASAIVYVPSGHTLFYNTTAVLNGAYTLAACAMVFMWQTAPKQWYAK